MFALLGLLPLLAHHCIAQAIPPSGCTLKSPAPAGAVCGVAGNSPVYQKPHRARTYKQRVSNVNQCRDLCLRRTDQACTNFRFNAATSTCSYNAKTLSSVTPNPSSDNVFYDRACFDCPSSCPQQIGVNLFDNGGFELSPRLLAPWAGSKKATAGKIVNGGAYGNSARAYQCSGSDSSCDLFQDFVSCDGAVYEFSFDYRAAPEGTDVFRSELQLDGGFTFFNIPAGSTAKTWHTYTNLYTFNQSNNGFDYYPQISKPGAIVQADNFKLVRTGYTLDAAPVATNVLHNGGFESGALSPWIVQFGKDTSSVVTPGISSGHAFQYLFPAGDSNDDLVLLQNLTDTGATMTPGTAYLLSLDYSSNVPGLRLDLTYGIRPAQSLSDSDNYINQSNAQGFFGQSGTAQMAFTGQESSNLLQLSFSLTGTTPASGGKLVLDNISIKELAAPQT